MPAISIGSSVAKAFADALFSGVGTWMAEGAQWVLLEISKILNQSTRVNLNAAWFLARSSIINSFLPVLALIFFIAASIQALVRHDAALLFRGVVVTLPAAIVLASSAAELASLGLSITDELSRGMSSGSGAQLSTVLATLATAMIKLSASGSAVPSFIAALLGLLVVAASLALWIELIVRASAIYVVVAFLPLALLCALWPALNVWARRLVETLVALILSKLVVVVVLDLGVGALSAGTDQGVGSILIGLAMVVLAAFSPFALFRLIPFVEIGAVAQLQGLRQSAQRSVQYGSLRSATTFAMGRLNQPLIPPLPPQNSVAHTSAGVRSSSDPMAHSAVTRMMNSPAPRSRGPGLEIGRDAWGPVIQPRRREDEGDA